MRSARNCESRKLERNQFVRDAAHLKGRVKFKAAQLENKLGIMDAGGSVINSSAYIQIGQDWPNLAIALRS